MRTSTGRIHDCVTDLDLPHRTTPFANKLVLMHCIEGAMQAMQLRSEIDGFAVSETRLSNAHLGPQLHY